MINPIDMALVAGAALLIITASIVIGELIAWHLINKGDKPRHSATPRRKT